MQGTLGITFPLITPDALVISQAIDAHRLVVTMCPAKSLQESPAAMKSQPDELQAGLPVTMRTVTAAILLSQQKQRKVDVVCWGSPDKIPYTGYINHRTLSSHSSGVGSPRRRCWQDWILLRSLFSVTFLVCGLVVFLYARILLLTLSLGQPD